MKTFNEAIGLGVKGCGGDVDNVEESGEIGPNLGCDNDVKQCRRCFSAVFLCGLIMQFVT